MFLAKVAQKRQILDFLLQMNFRHGKLNNVYLCLQVLGKISVFYTQDILSKLVLVSSRKHESY